MGTLFTPHHVQYSAHPDQVANLNCLSAFLTTSACDPPHSAICTTGEDTLEAISLH